MPYASVQDVRDLAPFVPINATSQPSEGTVLRWLSEQETYVDQVLSGIGYTVPITDADSVAIVKSILAHLVMARVMRGRPNPESDPEGFQRHADTILKRLRDPNDPLVLAAEGTDKPIKEHATRVSSNLSDLAAEDPVRYATRDMRF